jgi:hypothetical protein
MGDQQIEQIIRIVDNNGDDMFSEDELFSALEPIVKSWYGSFKGLKRSVSVGQGGKQPMMNCDRES